MKTLKKLATMLLSMILIFTTTSCSIFSNQPDNTDDDENNNSTPKTQTITVYNDDVPTTYTVTLGEVAEIDIFTKSESYFVGAYDAPDGGTKYFDGNGLSTMVWSAGNPDTYYARFASIYDLTYSQMQYAEEPYAMGTTGNGCYIAFDFSEELKSAIAGNLDKSLKVTLSLDISMNDKEPNKKGWDFNKIGITNLKNGGELIILDEKIPCKVDTYTNYVYTAEISSRLVQNGTIYVYMQNGYTIYSNFRYYAKNISVQIEFDDAQ